MSKSKYQSHVLPRFDEINGWVKQGALEKDIYERLGISKQAFYDYKNKYADFADLLKKSYDYCTDQVEGALYKKALSGDVVAQIFWLKNRRPDKWKDKPVDTTNDQNEAEALDKLCNAIKEVASK